MESYDDYKVGDTVYCLAWLGTPFTVSAKDDASGRICLQAPSTVDPYGSQIDLFPETMWMLTHSPWDRVWFWPDRAGETYESVFQRYAADVTVGDVVPGYYFDPGLLAPGPMCYLKPKPAISMAFRVEQVDVPSGQVLVRPVAAVDDAGGVTRDTTLELTPDRWTAIGPIAPVRIGMHNYRWGLAFGDVLLNWTDFLSP
jgi:hypothetical protein